MINHETNVLLESRFVFLCFLSPHPIGSLIKNKLQPVPHVWKWCVYIYRYSSWLRKIFESFIYRPCKRSERHKFRWSSGKVLVYY